MHAKQGLSMPPWTSFLFHSGPVRIPKAMDSIGYVWGCKKKNTVQCYDQVRSELAVNHRMTQHRSHCNCAASLAFVHVICVYLKECPSICNSLTPMKHVQALGLSFTQVLKPARLKAVCWKSIPRWLSRCPCFTGSKKALLLQFRRRGTKKRKGALRL